MSSYNLFLSFFFTDPATTWIYTLSLHDALPISVNFGTDVFMNRWQFIERLYLEMRDREIVPEFELFDLAVAHRSEEHTSELQSRSDLVCRLLLEKKKKKTKSESNKRDTSREVEC